MSVLKSVIDVNNGNSGWTRQNVLDALETALGNLGLNAGSTMSGVPQCAMAPDGVVSRRWETNANWNDANGYDQGSDYTWGSAKTQKYRVTDVIQASTISMTTNSGNGSDYDISGTDRSNTHTNASDPGIEIYVGDTLTFDNSALSGGHPMYIRVSDGGASVSNPAAAGEGTDTVSYTPTAAGTYYYQCGVSGHQGMIGTITVTTPTDDSYRIVKYVEEYLYNTAYVDTTNDEIRSDRHGFSTGDAVRYAKGQTDTAYDLGTTITKNTIYYIIKVNRDRFSLAASLADANNGVKIDIDGYTQTSVGTFECFTQDDQGTDYVNPGIDIYYGDTIQFENDNANATNFTLCRDVDSFDTNQRIVYNDATYGSTPVNQFSVSWRSNTTNISCAPGVNLTWNTTSYEQSESEPDYPASITAPAFSDVPGADGTKKYIYCSETHGSAKGVINIIPSYINTNYNWFNYPYYKYTVPASGGRSELKLRVWRNGYNNNSLRNITIHSIGSGWSDNEEFTIPGELVGGTATTGDIRFGVLTPETSDNAHDGTACIKTTTVGGGSNFYQKSPLGDWAVINTQNDATKKYSNTYYSILVSGDAGSAFKINMKSGNSWEFLNHYGTSSTSSTTSQWGKYEGFYGLDKQYSSQDAGNGMTEITMSTASTPTAYPLQIRTFRAQSPQDTNFAVIQFTQTINEKIEPYDSFTFHVGDGYGNGIFDLDEVYLAGITKYERVGNQAIRLSTHVPSYYSGYSSYYGANREPVISNSQARNAYYGYMRGYSSTYYFIDDYYNNISDGTTHARSTYYRNSTYDKYDNITMDSAADYYKPIKTIPISQLMIPCPYYVPDDFVLLQVVTTPGLTEFRPGDTVTVSGSEIYEVIIASYQTQQTGLDGVTNNSSEGMLFLARTT